MHICLYLPCKEIIDSAQISTNLLAKSRNAMFGVRKPLIQIPVLPLANRSQFTAQIMGDPSSQALVNLTLLLQRFQWYMISKLPSTTEDIQSMSVPSCPPREVVRALEGTFRHYSCSFPTGFPEGHSAWVGGLWVPSPDSFSLFYILGFYIKYNLETTWVLLLIKPTEPVLPSSVKL